MSRLTTRVVLSVLISLVVVAGIYTTVLGAPPWETRAGSHSVSGANVNLNHYRSAVFQSGGSGTQRDYISPNGNGHGCGSDSQVNSNDL
jgi:hypothetical protein